MARPSSDNLFLHPNGLWYKKVKNKVIYFGPDEAEAYSRWLRDKPYLLAGRTPPRSDGTPTVAELADVYANDLDQRVAAGEVGQRHANLVATTLKRFVGIVGRDGRVSDLAPLEWANVRTKLYEPVQRTQPVRADVYGRTCKRRSAGTVEGDVRRLRAFISWCVDAELIQPPRWGRMFNPTAPATVKKPTVPKFTGFDPADLRRIIRSATIQFRPLLLLGLNAGIGGSDIAAMTIDMVPKTSGEQWLDLPRRKTGNNRRFLLWPETVEAIRSYAKWRPRAAKAPDAKTLFLTKTGSPWIQVTTKDHKDSIGQTFARLRSAGGLSGGTFYDLRRQFQTVAAETLDFPAVQFVMGHAPSQRDMSARYTLKIDDDRIRNVCQHVRQWLLGGGENDLSSGDGAQSS